MPTAPSDLNQWRHFNSKNPMTRKPSKLDGRVSGSTRGYFHASPEQPGQTLLHRHSPSERHGIAPCRPCAEPFTSRHPDPVAAHARAQYALDARNRPCRHCDAKRGGETAEAEGLSRESLGRERFIERVWQWKATSGNRIVNQQKQLGESCDWDRLRFTMDDGLSKAVLEVFVRLYEDGLIYRGERLINWCPRCLTALSDIEVEHEEMKGKLYHHPLSARRRSRNSV